MFDFLGNLVDFLLQLGLLAALALILLLRWKKARDAKENFSGKSADFVTSAKKVADIGEYKLALAAIRNSLEALVKYIGRNKWRSLTENEPSLLDMIDALYDAGRGTINSEEHKLMHKIRIMGNKGVHVAINEEPVPESEARKAISMMERLIGMLGVTHGDKMPELFEGKVGTGN